MATIQEYDYVPVLVPTLVDGQTVNLPRFLRVALAAGCATVAGMADSTDFVDVIPATPAGFQLKTRVCPQLDDIVVTADIEDFTTDTPTTPLPGDGTAWTAGNPNDSDDTGTPITYNDPNILTDPSTN